MIDLITSNTFVLSAITASVATITTINATSITGSLLGNASSATTASYVLNAVSASFATTAVNATTASYVLNAVSASFASTASFAPNYVLNSATSSMLAPYLLISQTSSFATTGSNTFRGNQTITGSVNITGSTTITGSLNVSLGITGSLFGTASWANNATTTSYVLNAVSSSFASTASSADNFTVSSTSNVGIGLGTSTPTAQIQVHGDLEVRNGNIRFTDNGVESMRLTSNGDHITYGPNGERYVNGLLDPGPQPVLTEDDRQQLYNELNEVRFDREETVEDARERLEQAIASQLAAANERVAEKHLSFLENIEMGTLGIDAIQRMQRLAGVETLEQRLARLDAERERMISDARRTDEEAAEQWKVERKALTEEVNVAEQPVVPSKHNWVDKIKSGYEKIKVYITRSKMAKDTK